MSRLAGAPFYGVVVEGSSVEGVARTLTRLHGEMNRWEVPYNLIAYPVGAPGREGVRVVVVPRGEEYCESADQKLAGLEFLTGVLIPGPLRRDGMHAVLRGQAFEEASLGEGARLVFERRLRSVFGMPEAGAAVWPVAASSGVVGGPAYMPRLGANTVFAPKVVSFVAVASSGS